jgi:hypothetical protein
MSLYAPPTIVKTEVFARFPDDLRRNRKSEWADANRGGHPADCRPTHFMGEPGCLATNVAFQPGTGRLYITESGTGTVLVAELPVPGRRIYSHM